jgi:hypothetical protein
MRGQRQQSGFPFGEEEAYNPSRTSAETDCGWN